MDDMSDRVRAVQERRRSSAAGPHGRRPTRAEMLADALADEIASGDAIDEDEQDRSCPNLPGLDEGERG